jgi:hypothetical protein
MTNETALKRVWLPAGDRLCLSSYPVEIRFGPEGPRLFVEGREATCTFLDGRAPADPLSTLKACGEYCADGMDAFNSWELEEP